VGGTMSNLWTAEPAIHLHVLDETAWENWGSGEARGVGGILGRLLVAVKRQYGSCFVEHFAMDNGPT